MTFKTAHGKSKKTQRILNMYHTQYMPIYKGNYYNEAPHKDMLILTANILQEYPNTFLQAINSEEIPMIKLLSNPMVGQLTQKGD